MSIMSDKGQNVNYIIERIYKRGTTGLIFSADALSEQIQIDTRLKELIINKLKIWSKDNTNTEQERLAAAEALGRIGVTNELFILAKSNKVSQDVKLMFRH